ncbi:MAG TPA: dihydropteroate synthase, partial [Rhodothermales bacterium]
AELASASETAESAGVQSIILDPGFGFGKTVDENFALLGGIDCLRALGYPVLVGVSRKNSIGVAASGGSEPLPVDERLFGTLGATAVAVLRGASIVRTHDVRPTVEMLRTLARAAGSSDPRDV